MDKLNLGVTRGADGRSVIASDSSLRKQLIDWIPIFGYDVFISYKRQECSVYAGSLERQLRDRGRRCFLDDNEIPPGEPLDETLRIALRRSRVLAIVVSPGSLVSEYVEEELRIFSGYSRPIIPIRLSSVSIPWLGHHTLSHKSLLQTLMEERKLTWIDERENITGSDKASSEVVDRVVSYRRFQRSTVLRRLVLSVVFIAILCAALVAMHEARIAQRQAIDASEQRNTAIARQLVVQSTALLSDNPSALETGTLLAIESMKHRRLAENDRVLRDSLSLLPIPTATFHLKYGALIALSPDGRALAISDKDGPIRILQIPSGKEITRCSDIGSVTAIAFNGDGHFLASELIARLLVFLTFQVVMSVFE